MRGKCDTKYTFLKASTYVPLGFRDIRVGVTLRKLAYIVTLTRSGCREKWDPKNICLPQRT